MRPLHRWFFRRRLAWFPTVWGWLALLLVFGGSLGLFARHVGPWLSMNQPARGADGRGASTLVIEGWLGPSDLDAALQLWRRGGYERALTTGGPNYEWPVENGFDNYAERAADYLRRRGMPADRLFAVPAPASAQDRTFLSGVMVRDWAARHRVRLEAIDVYSLGAHTRRSRMLYQLAFGPTVAVGGIAARPVDYDDHQWWASSAGVKMVVGETLSVAWTICCFWPPRAGSHEERWGEPPSAPNAASAEPALTRAGRP